MKRDLVSRIVLGIFILFVLNTGCFLLYHSYRSDVTPLLSSRIDKIVGCDYETESGARGTASLPATVPANGWEHVTYRLALPDHVQDNEWLCLLTHTTFEVRINGEVRMEFDEYNTGISGSIEKSTYMFVPLSASDAGAEVEIEFKSDFSSNAFLRPLIVGDAYSIVLSIVSQNIFRYAGIIVLFVIALIGIIIGVILSLRRGVFASIIHIGFGILLVSAWLILDDSLYPFFFRNAYVDGICSYLCGVLSVFPFMLYVDRLQEGRYHKINLALEIFDLIFFILVCLFRFRFHMVLSEHLVLYTVPIVIMCAIWLYPIVKDFIEKKSAKYQTMVYGLIAFMFLSVLDIILINLSTERIDGNLVLLGLYVLSVAALFQQLQESSSLLSTLDLQNRQITSLSILAQTDPLTGLFNRQPLESAIRDLVAKKRGCVLFLFDLNHFKHINDTYGHPEGDRVLIAFAGALRSSFRQEDILCRVGGDEFVVLMRKEASPSLILQKRALILDSFVNDPEMSAYRKELGISMGVARMPKDGSDYEVLYRKADEEMYIDKNRTK